MCVTIFSALLLEGGGHSKHESYMSLKGELDDAKMTSVHIPHMAY